MSRSSEVSKNVAAVKEYFVRGDAGRMDMLDLFTDEFQFYFPKFGIGKGKAEFAQFVQGLIGSLKSISHDIEALKFLEGHNFVVVEGTTEGVYGDGTSWSGGDTPGGRFSSVFEFRDDGLISRMHIYLDPDYSGKDTDRFLWGADRWW
ncbi:nuclear transport factor 2 family protein [Paraburkholderia acidicola]|uniref:Nuclear transport factor 2 family protein n=1 Tax=Paraburkholderia acidicola TaxID=1912599 RepID=A0ABV1LLE9_9BURK